MHCFAFCGAKLGVGVKVFEGLPGFSLVYPNVSKVPPCYFLIMIIVSTILYTVHINVIIITYMMKHDLPKNKKSEKMTLLYIFRYFKVKLKSIFVIKTMF